MSKTKAELLKDNEQLRKRVASLERAMDHRTVASKASEELRVALEEAREQQTATSEILRVISQSPTDVQPVFETIVRSAVQLCDGLYGAVFRSDGGLIQLVAHDYPEGLDVLRRAFPMRVDESLLLARVMREAVVLNFGDLESDEGVPEVPRSLARANGYRSMVNVPMVLNGVGIGVISVARREVGRFSEGEVELLKIFADQAVIAIENVRLFKELEARNHDLTIALDQQTATAEILRVISSSPTDVQPVFDAIAHSAVRLLRAYTGALTRVAGDQIELATFMSTDESSDAIFSSLFPVLVRSNTSLHARALRDRGPFNITDTETDARLTEASRANARARGHRSLVVVPMLRHDEPVGTIGLTRREPGGFTGDEIALLQTFADQAVIAIENVRLFKELEARNRDLSEALEQQTATSEILRVISSSPTDLQPVLDAVAQSAARLCNANDALIYRLEDERLELVAKFGQVPLASEGLPLTRGLVTSRAVIDRETLHIEDLAAELDEFPDAETYVRRFSHRTILVTPLLREGFAIGAIAIRRTEVRPFSDNQVDLLKTFANQAVIAIENVRLFAELEARNRELTEALDQQTATSEILRVISQSHTDVQPVFAAVATSAARLCEAFDAAIHRIDGDVLRLAAHEGPIAPDAVLPLTQGTLAGHVVRERRAMQVADMQAETDVYPVSSEFARNRGFRTILAVPLLRGAETLGTITIRRTEVRPFTDRQAELLKTFADQAVIAVENVRLFTELQEKNRALTEAHARVTESLEQQTATSEILRVISGSPTDVQPVFDAIAQSAMRLCDGNFCTVTQYDGELLHLAAHAHVTVEDVEGLKQLFPMRPSRATVAGRAVAEGTVVHIPNLQADPEYIQPLGEALRARSGLGVPMMRGGEPVGVIGIGRFESRPFTDKEIVLLQTFADQAVIAIENVRLFTELQQKNDALTHAHAQVSEALEQQTATAEILRVISQSPTDTQPVFDAIATNAARLCSANDAQVLRVEGEVLRLVAAFGAPSMPSLRRLTRGHLVGRAVIDRKTIHVRDLAQALAEYPETTAARYGVQSALAVPLLRAGAALGVIRISRTGIRPFTDKQIALLQTFADQAVIAIENVRLFTELQARTAELTRSVGELTALGDVSRALSSTLDLEAVLQTIVTRANQLAGMDGCSIYEYDEAAEVFRLRASSYADPEESATLDPIGRATPIPKGQGVAGRAAALGQPVQIPDIAIEGSYDSPIRGALRQAGYRAILTVPLLLEEQVIGALGVSRKTPGEFAPEIVRLLTTFATQSALAIQNARLFQEIADKSRQLEVASQHKSEFLANMSHELRTPLNAIIGFSEVLTERMFGELNEKQDEYLKDIHASGTHLLSLINDILDLSKIEAGRMELELTEFDLPTAIDSAVTLVRERAGRRGITLQATVDEQLGEVRADERKIRQVVLNLLSNAIKFTPEGGRIEVRAVPVDGSVEVSVSDTGVGIAPEDQEAVFEEFRQVGTSAAKQEGTGLGLALCRRFVELHGGRIRVQSEVGGGSTFTFTIPVRRGE